MKPRKKILFISDHEESISELRMLLELRQHVRVQSIPSVHALWLIQHGDFDLVMAEVFARHGNAHELTEKIKRQFPELPVLLFSHEVSDYTLASLADGFIAEKFCTTAEIMNRVKVLIQRKRGPKKGSSIHDSYAREAGRKVAVKTA